MTATATKVLQVARGELGYREGPSNDTKYGRWYGLNYNPWCAMFVSWVASEAGAASIIPKHAYTPSGANWFKSRKQWGTTPRVGALWYQYNPALGRIAHVGFVEKVLSDGTFYTIEGNTNDGGSREGNGVYRKHRSLTPGSGFGYPKYKVVRKPKKHTPTIELSNVQPGKDNADVAALQRYLRSLGAEYRRLNPHGVTGYFGPETRAMYSKWQQQLGFRGRDTDGTPGWTSLSKLAKKLKFRAVKK